MFVAGRAGGLVSPPDDTGRGFCPSAGATVLSPGQRYGAGFSIRAPRRRSSVRATIERPVFLRKPKRARSFSARRSNRQRVENSFSGAAASVQSRGSQPPNGRRTAAPVLRGRPAARRRRAAWRSSGFHPSPSPPRSPRARRSFRPSAPATIYRPSNDPAAGGLHPSAATTVLFPSDARAPGVSPPGAAATPSHPAAGRGSLRRLRRRCLISGAGRRPIHPAAGGRPSVARTTALRPARAEGPSLRQHGDGVVSLCPSLAVSLSERKWL